MAILGKTTAVKLRVAGKERDLTRITPIEYLELTPKQVRECTEVHMGNIGLEKIRGFESLKNLECVWLNNNKLKYVNNLDTNFRIKTFYGQYNEICSLKGSLNCMRFLETLDLSHNKLRDLEKLLTYLEKFAFLETLNLKGNPCCEEPDYRLHVINKCPSVHVLDQHVVTSRERFEAKTAIGGDIAALTIAFGKRMPLPDEWIMKKVEERTEMEKRCNMEAEALRETRANNAKEADFRAHEHDPHPPAKAKEFPPSPPGWKGVRQSSPEAKPAATGRPDLSYVPRDNFRLYSLARERPDATEELDVPEGAGAGTLKLKSQKISEHLKRQTEQAQPIVMKRSEFKI